MIMIVGLQNPGAEYENTHHNAGAIIVRSFKDVHDFSSFDHSSKYAGEFTDGLVEGVDVRLLLPTTFMNASGSSVKKALSQNGSVEKLIVVYDDLDLPLGTFKISHGRRSGGHNGVESIINTLGTKEFTRVRIGISPVTIFGAMKKPVGARVADFVLKKFSKSERAKLDALAPAVCAALETLITEGKEKAMNVHN